MGTTVTVRCPKRVVKRAQHCGAERAGPSCGVGGGVGSHARRGWVGHRPSGLGDLAPEKNECGCQGFSLQPVWVIENS